MEDYPWLHVDGHLRARIAEETADYVGFDYRHVTERGHAGMATLTKADFREKYRLSPSEQL